MTFQSSYAFVIATLRDWCKNLQLIFEPMRSKTNRTLYTRDLSCALSNLQGIAWSSDWFIGLFAPVVIGGSNYFGISLSTVI